MRLPGQVIAGDADEMVGVVIDVDGDLAQRVGGGDETADDVIFVGCGQPQAAGDDGLLAQGIVAIFGGAAARVGGAG